MKFPENDWTGIVSFAAILAGVSLLGALPGMAEDKQARAIVPQAEAVGNFGLFDHQGEFHELYYHDKDPETRLLVLFIQGNGCPLVRKRIPELNRLQERYARQGIRFWMLNANSQDSLEEIREEAEAYDFQMPVLLDPAQLVAETLDLKRTGEAIVIEPGSWNIRYRGAIDDRLDYETEKPKAGKTYLVDALEQFLEGKPIETARTDAPGCRIRYVHHKASGSPKDLKTDRTYTDKVAPILMQRCAHCHTKGGIGPWAMSSYRKIRGWADMIEEVVMTRRMPPWQADPHVGAFANDFSMTEEETVTLVNWIRAGTPRGLGPDPLQTHKPKLPEWALGEPDHVIEIPTQKVPAEGVVDYRYLTIDSPFDRDVWVRAVDVRPGNTRVLHHVIATSFMKVKGKDRHQRGLAGYAPGMGPEVFPDNSGIFLRAGSKIRFQLHYTVSGKPETDDTRLGLYLHKTAPAKELRGGLLIDTKFKIPPGEREFTHSKTNHIRRDILLYSMNPHMHYRGKRMSYEAHYPDGTREVLLSVPHYHFNWQRNYWLAKPKFLPKNTRLVVHAAWDNSPLNSYNPDPSLEVKWGEQSFEEMFFASYKYTVVEPGEKRAPATAQLTE